MNLPIPRGSGRVMRHSTICIHLRPDCRRIYARTTHPRVFERHSRSSQERSGRGKGAGERCTGISRRRHGPGEAGGVYGHLRRKAGRAGNRRGGGISAGGCGGGSSTGGKPTGKAVLIYPSLRRLSRTGPRGRQRHLYTIPVRGGGREDHGGEPDDQHR
jgi:hypothetical protein